MKSLLSKGSVSNVFADNNENGEYVQLSLSVRMRLSNKLRNDSIIIKVLMLSYRSDIKRTTSCEDSQQLQIPLFTSKQAIFDRTQTNITVLK